MSTTVSITPCWKSAALDFGRLILAGLVLVLWCSAIWAQHSVAEVTQLRFERDAEAIYLSASVSFEVPPVVEEALVKGVPMVFVAEVDVFRERWYWTNKRVVSAQRQMRLSFQPLSRRWRLTMGSGPLTAAGLGVALNQNFETLADALSAMQRLSRWRIAELAELDLEQAHQVEFRFRLDLAQLPRPFQIGSLGQSEWNIATAVGRRLVLEPVK